MRRILATCLLLAVALPCHAQGDKPKPNTLTAKEIADGWILLFDGETTFGWKPLEPGGGLPTVKNRQLDLASIGKSAVLFPPPNVGQFELVCEFTAWERGARIFFTNIEANNATESHVLTATKKSTVFSWKSPPGRWVMGFDQRDGGKVAIRILKLRPLNMTSLFNGKDLTGWKEFPGKKSKFAVIDSAINVKDGPGDLQTVGKYKDFVLQLDCISNGKHLNSGIFFRCRDNEYQNGYEAQIRNEFTEKPTQKYQIEEYDPKTNKLLGKKEQLFTAVDFGTGAIYRRQPARKQMSKDGEWFAMTIVAHGNHLATWVNGVQVTDWYDHRPKSDNARTGCKLDAGHISIQGHDPTTDLSFKNFRIAELK